MNRLLKSLMKSLLFKFKGIKKIKKNDVIEFNKKDLWNFIG